ncbi:acetylxylan esterase [Streptomyces sp. NPDC057136]|uniref:acetylxylan esterase n=1 Tax=Streptomyces sp. NPDC057136 TaxID=3346029 RepID=UPI0036433A69
MLCGIRHALDLTDAGPYGEIAGYLAVHRGAGSAAYRTLSCVEGVPFARRAGAPAHFGVGLRETVCPPSGAYAAYNRYGELAGDGPPREIHACLSTGTRVATPCTRAVNSPGCAASWGTMTRHGTAYSR